ncbi:MAG: sarcosine oxidase subunit beta family protein [Actinomycetota bacterium]|nr:sarcosine oxidase subunit beta family protein [Actinomycetota bacterium]
MQRRPRQRYSAAAILGHAISRHRRWRPVLSDDPPRGAYDAIIIGGGGHGLATAFYLARDHGITNVAVLDKSWLGGGNVTRNTAIVRSNYFLSARGDLAEWSLQLWESLSEELNFNVMFSQRGILNLAHGTAQLDDFARRANAMAVRGLEAELLTVEEVARLVPRLDVSPEARFPIKGGLLQARAGTVRHDAVPWGYARAASSLGVDIIQNCEVTGFLLDGARVKGVETNRGRIFSDRVGAAVSAGSTPVAHAAGIALPIENHILQAAVTEPLAPVLDLIVTHGVLNFYVSQTDKGELLLGGNIDGFNTYSSRGTLPPIEEVVRAFLSLFPSFGRVRLLRTWGGSVDMSMDGAPILSKTPLEGFYVNTGWCYGGFKTTPAVGKLLAEMIATDTTPSLAAPFALDRFTSGRIVPEEGYGPKPWRYH